MSFEVVGATVKTPEGEFPYIISMPVEFAGKTKEEFLLYWFDVNYDKGSKQKFRDLETGEEWTCEKPKLKGAKAICRSNLGRTARFEKIGKFHVKKEGELIEVGPLYYPVIR